MSNSVEAKIHNILLDIDPSLHKDYEEQSLIVAEATGNYKFAESKIQLRSASKKELIKNEEALMIDSILQAMNTLIESNTTRYAINDYNNYEDDELSYETVLKNLRVCSNDFGDMNIINDSDLDSFLEKDKSADWLFDIQDIFDDDRPNSELYKLPGIKKHRSDSIIR